MLFWTWSFEKNWNFEEIKNEIHSSIYIYIFNFILMCHDFQEIEYGWFFKLKTCSTKCWVVKFIRFAFYNEERVFSLPI